MESYWLQGRFIGGAKPCLADLLMACELQQLEMLEGSEGPERMAGILAPHPRVQTWMRDVREVSRLILDSLTAVGLKGEGRLALRFSPTH